MEASAIQAPAVVARPRPSLAASLLRLRSDEQLVALFRAGHDEAFRVIHDRYRQRLFAYARQMLPGRQDAEDALQDVFVRAYSNLRANDRDLALRAWLYRVAHNRCVDELRRPAPPPPETMQFIRSPIQDPIAQADQRESLRRLVEDVRRLPPQQRSALLMRELGGMPYADLADALGVSVPAVKSLLVRARMALAQAVEARETACADIREELIVAHDRRTRPNANTRRHLRDCAGCRQFRGDMRGMSRQLAALTPAIGPLGVAAKVLGLGGGAGGGAAAGSGAAAAAGSGSAVVSAGALATGAGHVATLIAATVVTAGGAVEIQRTITDPPPAHHHHRVHHARAAGPAPASSVAVVELSSGTGSTGVATPAPTAAYLPPAGSSASASSSATAGTPLKAITGKAVKKLSSAVSATTKDATKQLKPGTKVTDASGKTTSSTGTSTTLGGSAAASGTTTGTGTGSPGASTSTSSGTTPGGGSGTSSSGTTSPSSDGSTPASAAGAPGSAAAGSSTSGTPATGSSPS